MSPEGSEPGRPRPEERLDVRIERRTTEAIDIVSLELVALDGGELPAFEAGSHIDVEIGVGLIRQYSLCNPPSERHRYRLGVLRDAASRGGSERLHRELFQGRHIRIGLPRCNFRLVDGPQTAILLAGGIGITPLLAMAHELHARSTPFVLHYCARSRDRTAFADEIAASPWSSSVRMHFDDGPESQRLSLDALLVDPAPDAQLYVCGPEGFIHFVTAGAASRGWPAERVHVEHFNAEVTQDGKAFEVEAAVSGVTVQVPEGQSIAHALIAAGVDVPLSCEQGICGTCLTAVRYGTPDHRDEYQTDEEKSANTHITLCCSRSLSPRLVIDL